MLMVLMMPSCMGMGPGSLPADDHDAHDAHVKPGSLPCGWGWGQEVSQLLLMMLMMRACLRIGPRSLSADVHEAHDAHVLWNGARQPLS